MTTPEIYKPLFNGTSAVVHGELVRIIANNVFTRAQADSSAHLAGYVGVNGSGTVGTGGPANIYTAGASVDVLLDVGLTPAAGNIIYVSAATAGRGTTAPPAMPFPIGVIEDASKYGQTLLVTVALFGNSTVDEIVAANWTLGITRVYAIDGINGNDANLGYADPTTTGSAAYAIACQAAGLVAKKTFAGLGAIFPRVGAERNVEIVIANGGSNTTLNYADDIATAMGGSVGYNRFGIRSTGANTTAGCTAFDGSTADATYLGGVTATGLNAAGYNPTGVPTTTQIQCVLNGGGAPGFAAEPAAPFGFRVRFDANTATAALRNICRQVMVVAGGDTLTFNVALPAVPAVSASEKFYIEASGVTCNGAAIGSPAPATLQPMSVAGVAPSTITMSDGRFALAFSTVASSINVSDCPAVTLATTYSHSVLGTMTPAGSYSAGSMTFINSGVTIRSAVSVSSTTINNPISLVITGLMVSVTSFTVIENCQRLYNTSYNGFTLTPNIGGTTAVIGTAPRLTGLSMLRGGNIVITQMVGLASGQNGISFKGTWNVNFSEAGANISITGAPIGNAGVQFDNSGTAILDPANLPTITGSAGNIGCGQGRNLTWTAAAGGGFGYLDIGGMAFYGFDSTLFPNTLPLRATTPINLSGTLFGGGGATLTYLANSGDAIAVNVTTPYAWPGPNVAMAKLIVKPRVNTMTNACTATLYKNGVATNVTVSIPAGSTAVVSINNTFNPEGNTLMTFSDSYDLRLDDPGADAGHTLAVSAVLCHA